MENLNVLNFAALNDSAKNKANELVNKMFTGKITKKEKELLQGLSDKANELSEILETQPTGKKPTGKKPTGKKPTGKKPTGKKVVVETDSNWMSNIVKGEYIVNSGRVFGTYNGKQYEVKSLLANCAYTFDLIDERVADNINLFYAKYTEKSFIVVGNHKPYKNELKKLKGRFVWAVINHHKFPAWLFANRQIDSVKSFLHKLPVDVECLTGPIFAE